MKKNINNHGESLIETLVSMLIIALCILMLQGSIVTAAKVNNKTKTNIEPFQISDTDIVVGEVKINNWNTGVSIYQTKGGYNYYGK